MLQRFFRKNTTSIPINYFEYLPNEMVFEILAFLSIKDIKKIMNLDKRMNNLINQVPANHILVCSNKEILKKAIYDSPEYYYILFQFKDQSYKTEQQGPQQNETNQSYQSWGETFLNGTMNIFSNLRKYISEDQKVESDVELGSRNAKKIEIRTGTYAEILYGSKNISNYCLLDKKLKKLANPYVKLATISLMGGGIIWGGALVSSLSILWSNCPEETHYYNVTNSKTGETSTQIETLPHCSSHTNNTIYAPLLGTTLPAGLLSVCAGFFFSKKAVETSAKNKKKRNAYLLEQTTMRQNTNLFLLSNMKNEKEDVIDAVIKSKESLLQLNQICKI